MKCTVFLAILSMMLTCGCASSRISYVVQMHDKKPIVLNNQYRLEGIYCDGRQFHLFDHPLPPLYYRKKAAEIRQGIATELHNLLPKNFTASGKPFRINVTEVKYEADIDRRKYLYYCCSAGIIPVTTMKKFNILYEVQLLDADGRREAFEIDEVYESAMSFSSPFGFFIYDEDPYFIYDDDDEDPYIEKVKPFFCDHIKNWFLWGLRSQEERATILHYKSVAYAVVLKLMEMEAAEAASLSQAGQQTMSSPHQSTPIHQQPFAQPPTASPQSVSQP